MLASFYTTITNSIIREKLYKSFQVYSGFNYLKEEFNINEIKITFLLSNTLLNKTIFFALLLLLERISLVNFSFIVSKKTIANFNMKKNLRIGAVYSLRGNNKDEFLHQFIQYSLKKVEDSLVFINPKTHAVKLFFTNDSHGMSLRSMLFYSSISLNNKDYDLFAPFFENIAYGSYLYLFTGFRNQYLNNLILSQYGMLVY